MLESGNTKIFVVSMADAMERRARFAQLITPAAPDWEFFSAHTQLAPALLYDNAATHATHGRTLRNGELGCYSSHHALWQWLLDSDYRQMIVMEDDVQADWNFIGFLMRHDFDAMNISYLRLFAKIPARWRYVASPFLDRYRHLIRFTGYALGTQAYLLTKSGAAQLLRHAKNVRFPVDVYMDRYWEHGVPNLAIYPFPVFECYQPSSIGQQRFEREVVPLVASMRFQLDRVVAKTRMLHAHYFGSDDARALRQKLQRNFSG